MTLTVRLPTRAEIIRTNRLFERLNRAHCDAETVDEIRKIEVGQKIQSIKRGEIPPRR